MKLLIVTQSVDTEDPVLGFFVQWIEELSKQCEQVEVICLKEGNHALPTNVRVHSLGKPCSAKATQGTGTRLRYVWRFILLAWELRHNYDAVFVHMNQEYILIAGWFLKLFRKRVYLWRNHYAGSWLTDVAAIFCTKIFCTSKHSYTAKYTKTVLMPVGVNTEQFFPDAHVARKSHSILSLGRISPSKRLEIFIDALAMLVRDGVDFTASIVGSSLQKDEIYYEGLKEKVRSLSLVSRVMFFQGISNSQTPNLYRAHEVFVNTSPSGMLDKTIFEAAACGCFVLAASADFAAVAGSDFHFDSSAELAATLKKHIASILLVTDLTKFVENNSLSVLGSRLAEEMNA